MIVASKGHCTEIVQHFYITLYISLQMWAYINVFAEICYPVSWKWFPPPWEKMFQFFYFVHRVLLDFEQNSNFSRTFYKNWWSNKKVLLSIHAHSFWLPHFPIWKSRCEFSYNVSSIGFKMKYGEGKDAADVWREAYAMKDTFLIYVLRVRSLLHL